MTILLTILLGLTIVIGFLLFIALITRRAYTVEREILINKPREEVFNYLKLMRNQEQYNVWMRRDPNVKINYNGIDGTVGFTSAWKGNKQAGKGEQEIKNIEAGKTLHLEIRFVEPFKNIGQTFMTITSVAPDQTLLKWQMIGENNFPMNLMNLMIDGLLGKDLQKSLINVKNILEHN